MKIQKKPAAEVDELDDEETTPAKVVKKAKKATAKLADDDDEETTDEDTEVLSESRPKTGKDRLKVPKVSQAVIAKKRKVVVQDEDEAEDDEMTQEELIAYHQDELRKLKQYGGVKLLPRKKGAFGLHTKDGVRRASVAARPRGEDEDEMVKVTMLKTCDPAPRVGNVSVVVDHGHDKLLRNEMYLLPRSVALHLTEQKYALMHEGAE